MRVFYLFFLFLILGCSTSKQLNDSDVVGRYSYEATGYGVGSTVEFNEDKTFIYTWVTGLLKGTTEGTWSFSDNKIVLNSNRKESEDVKFKILENSDNNSDFFSFKSLDENKNIVPNVNCILLKDNNETKGFEANFDGELQISKKEDFQKLKEMTKDTSNVVIHKALPYANKGQAGALYVEPDTYRALYGSETALGNGCWFDGPFYPKEVRNDWITNGEFIPWRGSPARLLDPKVLYGSKLGNALQEWHIGNVLKTMAWDKTKIGAKLIGLGSIIWFVSIVLLKRYQLEYRDHITAQLIFAERINSLEEYYPVTEASVHQQLRLKGYLQSYYEEEDEEEEEDDEL